MNLYLKIAFLFSFIINVGFSSFNKEESSSQKISIISPLCYNRNSDEFTDKSHDFLSTKEAVLTIKSHFSSINEEITLNLKEISLANSSTMRVETLKKRRIDSMVFNPDKNYDRRGFEFSIVSEDIEVGDVRVIESATHFDLGLITIEPEFESKGLGTKALQKLITFFEVNKIFDFQEMTLTVASENPKAALVYGRVGFWPYIFNSTNDQLIPLTIQKTSAYFFDHQKYCSEIDNTPIKMVRQKGASNISINGRHTIEQIENILMKFYSVTQ